MRRPLAHQLKAKRRWRKQPSWWSRALSGAAITAVALMYKKWTGSRASCEVPLEIAASSIPSAGLGLFIPADAQRVKEGTVLTMYGGKEVRIEETEGTELETYSMFMPHKPGWARAGTPWKGPVPAKVCGEPIGHLINDGASITIDPDLRPSFKELHQLVKAYKQESARRKNVQFAADGMVTWRMVATRSIKPGEELFMPYQDYYWLSELYKHSPDPFTRLLAYLYTVEHHPDRFPDSYIHLDEGMQPHVSQGGHVASEAVCRQFVVDVLGVGAGSEGEEPMVRGLGLGKQWTYRQMVQRMAQEVMKGEGEGA